MVARLAPRSVITSTSTVLLLAATLLVAGAAWAIVSWQDARRGLQGHMSANADAFRVDATLVLAAAESRLRRGDSAIASDLGTIAQNPLSEARDSAQEGQVGLSRPFKTDDGWRALMVLPQADSDQPLAATIVDLNVFAD